MLETFHWQLSCSAAMYLMVVGEHVKCVLSSYPTMQVLPVNCSMWLFYVCNTLTLGQWNQSTLLLEGYPSVGSLCSFGMLRVTSLFMPVGVLLKVLWCPLHALSGLCQADLPPPAPWQACLRRLCCVWFTSPYPSYSTLHTAYPCPAIWCSKRFMHKVSQEYHTEILPQKH